MVTFSEACEIASRYYGMNCLTSCIGRAWESRKEYFFEPALNSGVYGEGTSRRWRISVNKDIGYITETQIAFGEDATDRILWKYRAVEKPAGVV